jgi:hypothetical protein
MSKKATNFHSAKSGRYVSKEDAAASRDTTLPKTRWRVATNTPTNS